MTNDAHDTTTPDAPTADAGSAKDVNPRDTDHPAGEEQAADNSATESPS